MFLRQETVDDVVVQFTNIVEKLDVLAAKHAAKADELAEQLKGHKEEHARAVKLSKNIGNLLN